MRAVVSAQMKAVRAEIAGTCRPHSGWPAPGCGCGWCARWAPGHHIVPVRPAPRSDGENHSGLGVDRLGIGQALVQAQGAPGPERDRVADDRAQPAVLVVGAVERCGDDVAEEDVLVPQSLLVVLAGSRAAPGCPKPISLRSPHCRRGRTARMAARRGRPGRRGWHVALSSPRRLRGARRSHGVC
jgi:hypothetical protein